MDGTGENPTRGVEVLVVAGHDQDGKSENVTICRRGELDRPFDGGARRGAKSTSECEVSAEE